ncbi:MULTISPECIES: fasciclin domain-containing protein [Haloferax]|uniref:Fasciclin domain-containing protein n=2 Tax=Haloferax TaxID=2251 RepID=A0A6G1Z3T0_9EURY|nr:MULTISPECIES: fasciclin domain-containing protein [Haloferax]KAB1188276.1 fasciclin domain-containing protein [Haloferax sp. CBA1149]MRW80964.1 fasciclin domain-containing protein [Haloferax marinisediminis]
MTFNPDRRQALKTIGGAGLLLAGGAGVASAKPPRDGPTIVDIASGDDRFDILVAAVVAAGLDGALSGNRQLTVLAPTDDAFVALFSELAGVELTEEDVLDAIETGNLPAGLTIDDVASILLYHVVPGRRKEKSVVRVPKLPTLNGAKIAVDGTELNDGQADIVITDITASNGVIHALNGVLLP